MKILPEDYMRGFITRCVNKYPDGDIGDFEHHPGYWCNGWVYFIYHDDVLLYIGCAACMKCRMSRHHIYNQRFHKVVFMEAAGDMYSFETNLIRIHNPPLNYNGKLQNRYKESMFDISVVSC